MASILAIGEKWRAQIRLKGKTATRTFKTERDARAWARGQEYEIERGDFSSHGELSKITFHDLVTRYTQDISEVKPFGRTKGFSLKLLDRHLGHVTLDKFDDRTVVDFAKARRTQGAGAVTIAVDVSYLGNVFKIAKSLWRVPIKENPVLLAREMLNYLGLTGKSNERDRRPTQGEINALCQHFSASKTQIIPMSEVIPFAIATAMRAGEIFALLWSDVDVVNRTVLIRDRKDPKFKMGNNQTVPLLKIGDIDAFEIAMRQQRTSVRIFPFNHKSVSSIFPRACAKLGIEDLHFHDLRHEGVSRLFEAGYRIEQVALVSGHKNWKQLQRYTQVKAKDLHR